MSRTNDRLPRALVLPALVLLICFAKESNAQTWSSGSTEADGALNLTTPGTVLFDPKTFSPPLNPAGDNIFNFTSINIASGVTLRLSGNILNGPVFFLASGSVQIDGTIDLSGEPGHAEGKNLGDRIPSAPGPGGYGGGVGGKDAFTPKPGNGPGGGAVFICRDNVSCGGTFTGSEFLIPLIGGSGGGGEAQVSGCGGGNFGGGGGAGGGALLVASSVSIVVKGAIKANGGAAGCDGGNGSGGAIRLMAPSISGTGTITARGLQPYTGGGKSENSTDGRIRLEAYQQNFTGSFNGTPTSKSPPFNVVLPATPPPSILVKTIAGIPINANPFSFPDAIINLSSPVSIMIEARNVPPGTVPKIVVLSENVGDQIISAPPLLGTLQLSTSSVNVTLPAGGSRGYVKATW